MKKEVTFIAVMIILGITITFIVTATGSNFGISSDSHRPILTIEEKESLEPLDRNWTWRKNIVLMVTPLPLVILGYGLFILNLNPNIKRSKRKGGIFKALIVHLLGLGVYLIIFNHIVIGYFSLPAYLISAPTSFFLDLDRELIINFLAAFLISGLFWIIAGEMGWAGDFSSWKSGTKEKKAKPFPCFILGGIVGVTSVGFLLLNEWALIKYFIFVNRVLSKTGMLYSYELSAYGQIFLLSLSLAITAGLVVALSPVYMDTKARFKRLIFPCGLTVIMVIAVFGTYQYASAKYDFNKKSLADAVGIPDKVSISKTVLLFKKDKEGNEIILQEWPMQVLYFNPTYNIFKMLKGDEEIYSSSTIELSYKNMEKVEDYLFKHRDGSVFNRAAEYVLDDGYHILWDIEKALERQFISSQRNYSPRFDMIGRMQYLFVTPQNLKYLESFADETKWYIRGDYALDIALGFIHFGMPEEAQKWIDKAKQRGAGPERVAAVQKLLPTSHILTKGRIYGSITVNGEVPLNTKVAILNSQGHDYNYVFGDPRNFIEEVRPILTTRLLIDAKKLDQQGKFIFDYLGKGKYFLGLMTDKEAIPYDISPEKITVKNSPGVIELGEKISVVDLGDIDIVVK